MFSFVLGHFSWGKSFCLKPDLVIASLTELLFFLCKTPFPRPLRITRESLDLVPAEILPQRELGFLLILNRQSKDLRIFCCRSSAETKSQLTPLAK